MLGVRCYIPVASMRHGRRIGIAQAALLPGEGATVVLRIEVLTSGEPGRIEADVTSGSRQVDQAAIAYARQHYRYAGRVRELSEAMWIRWGVRLQA